MGSGTDRVYCRVRSSQYGWEYAFEGGKLGKDFSIMKALLLAAGLGTRLRLLTNHIPKCLVKIDGKPLLNIWIDRLLQADFSYILVNTHYLSDVVYEHLEANYAHEVQSGRIKTVNEETLLGTAGTLLKIVPLYAVTEF